jgi:hypothetical protein
MRTTTPSLLLLALLGLAPAASAQVGAGEPAAPAAEATGTAAPETSLSRAAMLAAARDQKTLERAPVSRGAVEKGLYWYDNQHVLPKVFGKWKGIHLAGGGFPAGAGMKYGIGYDQGLGRQELTTGLNRVGIDAVAARSTRGYQRLSGGLTVRNLFGAPVDARVWGQRYDFPQEDLFGIGMDSSVDDRTNYLHESTEVGASLTWRLASHFEVTGGVAHLDPRIGAGTDSRFPSTELRYDDATLPGLSAQPNFLRADAGVAFDWRDSATHPHAGGRYAVKLSNYDDRDLSAYGFRRIDVEAQQYVPLPHRYRVLALRAAAVMTDASAGQQVPFYYQPTLGGSQELRGFREFRFRDQNSLVLTAEYRWEAWWMLDAAVFVDAGTVAAERRDLSLRNLETSYGVGLRLHSNKAFVARLDLARSREGFIPLLRFEHVF